MVTQVVFSLSHCRLEMAVVCHLTKCWMGILSLVLLDAWTGVQVVMSLNANLLSFVLLLEVQVVLSLTYYWVAMTAVCQLTH